MSHVVTISGRHWPAWVRPDGTLVDFRLLDDSGALCYLPAKLPASGVPADLIAAAADSVPPGFVLLPPAS